MTQEYILCPNSINYVPSVQSMSHDYSLFHNDLVYVPRVQSLSQEYILCPKSTFITQESRLCSKIAINKQLVQFNS